jgi:hypothetical protein
LSAIGTTFGHAAVGARLKNPVPAHCASAAMRSMTLPRTSGKPAAGALFG